jgi:type II secretory pathway pseudopilin PulG
MQGSKQVFINAERGVSLVGLIFVLAILGFVGIFAAKVFPTYLESRAIQNAIVAAKGTGGTVQEMRVAFDKNANINNVESITSKDLDFAKGEGGTEISFSYEKRIPIIANATLLMLYSGTTDKSGKAPVKDDITKP